MWLSADAIDGEADQRLRSVDRVHPVRQVRLLDVEPHGVAAVEQRTEALVEIDHLPQPIRLDVVEREQVPLDAEVTEHRRRGAERRACATGRWCAIAVGPMWAPISSGGISIEAPRWIVWRSRASLQSLVQTRTVRRRIS